MTAPAVPPLRPGAEPQFAAMEGDGAYNHHGRMQAAGAAVAMPHLIEAAHAVAPPDGPLLIADYGASQGRNSLAPMRAAIATLRSRFGPARAISVSHVDVASNDFGALFATLNDDPASYLHEDPHIFCNAVGRSFFEPLFPPGSVTLGWSAFAAQWLSRTPALIPGHFHELCATDDVRAAFRAQGEADWCRFLALRAEELCPTGRLVVLLPACDASGRQGIEPLFDAANAAVAELVARGVLSADERANMVVPDRMRERAELCAPFTDGVFAGLALERCDIGRGPDGIWESFCVHGDATRLARERARFFRATFAPALATALDRTRTPDERHGFMTMLESILVDRLLAMDPFEIPVMLATVVLARVRA